MFIDVITYIHRTYIGKAIERKQHIRNIAGSDKPNKSGEGHVDLCISREMLDKDN